MDFQNLIRFIKAQGCRVTIFKNKTRIQGALGLFHEDPHPLIQLAVKGRSKRERVSTLLHEYGHFCQSRDGFSKYLDNICWPHNIHEEWIDKKIELTKREIKMVRATMLSVEYDAEIRAYKMGNELQPKNWDSAYHLREAQSYIAAIKWSFKHRKDWKKRPPGKLHPATILSFDQLFAPLTAKEKKILKKIKA